jgi:hypothetical protein
MKKNTEVTTPVVVASTTAAAPGSLSAGEVQTLTNQVTNMATLIGEGRDPMTPIERLHTPRARMKVLSSLTTLITLAREQGLDATSIATVVATKAYLDLLTPLATKIDGLTRILGDTILNLQSDIWAQARGLYVQLQGKAKTNPILDEALEPLREAFRIPRRAPAKDATTKSTAKKSAATSTAAATEATPETAAVGEATAATTGAATHA